MRISIITVCRNSENTIERAIRSVVRQDYDDIEYILIDGDSSDRTVDIIKKYERDISFWSSEKDEGIYDAMNKGLEHSTGEIVAFLNSDDWYEENIFSDIMSYFKDETVQLLCGDMYVHREGMISRHHVNEEASQKAVRFSMGYPHPTMFARKRLFDQYGKFDTQYKIAADYDWFLKVYDHNEKIKVVDRVFTNFSYGGVSTKEETTLCMLEEQKQVALKALGRNGALTEKEKWRKVIESENENMRYSFKMQQVLSDELFDKNLTVLKRCRGIFKETKYAVFGSGNIAVQLVGILQKLDISITKIWDNNAENWGKNINGIKVVKPEKKEIDQDTIIIAAIYYENEIETQLKEYGLIKNTQYLLYRELRKLIVDMVENCAG